MIEVRTNLTLDALKKYHRFGVLAKWNIGKILRLVLPAAVIIYTLYSFSVYGKYKNELDEWNTGYAPGLDEYLESVKDSVENEGDLAKRLAEDIEAAAGVVLELGLENADLKARIYRHFLLYLSVLSLFLIYGFFDSAYNYKRRAGKEFKAVHPSMLEEDSVYQFFEEHFTRTYESSTYKSAFEMRYDFIEVIYETDEFFYIHQHNGFVLLDKKRFTQGTPEGLADILAGHFSTKKFPFRRYTEWKPLGAG
jgi:hypothetical protein